MERKTTSISKKLKDGNFWRTEEPTGKIRSQAAIHVELIAADFVQSPIPLPILDDAGRLAEPGKRLNERRGKDLAKLLEELGQGTPARQAYLTAVGMTGKLEIYSPSAQALSGVGIVG
jgi:hypothetical protein